MADTARWHARPYSYRSARLLARELGLSATTASVLVRRGFDDPATARRFLAGADTHHASEMAGIDAAVELILRRARRALIAVHGDYDVDGVCSTALIVRALRALGANVRPVLPSRLADGYGVAAATVERLAREGVSLLVTADCGIGAAAEVELAKRLGMEVVVTDHHRPGEVLPDCPIVHPALCGYPCPELCATGVVYKLAQALHEASGRDPAALEDDLDLVALATVADVVPLVGENRALVKKGMKVLASTAKPGLRALMKVAGVEPQAVGERALGFALAPRINAAGRIDRPDAALELLLTEDPARALEVARELDALNVERQAVETRILSDAERLLAEAGEHAADPVHILAGEGWHPGVVGIVASRLVERRNRPCVLIALDGDGRGRGSGRSISAYDLHAGLAACADHLLRFGGHRMAAGVEIAAEAVARFRASLVGHARGVLRDDDLVPIERVDAVVPGDFLGLPLAEELDALRPFGVGNPGVNLLVPAARVSDVHPMGEGRHARFTIKSAGVNARAVAFGVGEGLNGAAGPVRPYDLVARLESNEWQGVVEPRLVLRTIHPLEEAGDTCADTGGCAHCSCRATGDRFWAAVWRELEAPLAVPSAAAPAGGSRTVVDSRGRGVLGCVGDLLSTGESVLVACADVSRRRSLLDRELRPDRFGRPAAGVHSIRCMPRDDEEGDFLLTDYATIAASPELLERFTHVFALDPPPSRRLDALLRASAPSQGEHEAFYHLGWGPSELALALRVAEQDYGLRATLKAVYRALAGHGRPAAGADLERFLCGDGRHPRSPATVGRCLRVLTELGLVALERSSATVRCTIITKGGVDLERSEAFRSYSLVHQEAIRFLSGQAQPGSATRAA